MACDSRQSMRTDQLLKLLEPWRVAHRRPAYRPVTVAGDGPSDCSKFGGQPYLEPGETWPACGDCGASLTFLLQLNLSSVPEGFSTKGLLQLFYCTQVDCNGAGWEAFSPTHCVRIVEGAGEEGRQDAPTRLLRASRIEGWERFDDGPHPEDFDDLGLHLDYDFAADTVTVRCPMADVTETVSNTDDVDDELAKRIGACQAGDKLGGWPCWMQGAERPSCRTCGETMEVVFQVDSEQGVDFMFGDAGIGHVSQCPRHPNVVAFAWACS